MKTLVFCLIILLFPLSSFANEIKSVEGLYTITLDNDWDTSSFRKDGDNYYVSYEYTGKKEIGFASVDINITKYKSKVELEDALSKVVSWVVNAPFTEESQLDSISLKRYDIEHLRFITEYHQYGKSHFYIDYYFVVDDNFIRIDFPTEIVGNLDVNQNNIQSFIYGIKFK